MDWRPAQARNSLDLLNSGICVALTFRNTSLENIVSLCLPDRSKVLLLIYEKCHPASLSGVLAQIQEHAATHSNESGY